jgi:hypothetical protein
MLFNRATVVGSMSYMEPMAEFKADSYIVYVRIPSLASARQVASKGRGVKGRSYTRSVARQTREFPCPCPRWRLLEESRQVSVSSDRIHGQRRNSNVMLFLWAECCLTLCQSYLRVDWLYGTRATGFPQPSRKHVSRRVSHFRPHQTSPSSSPLSHCLVHCFQQKEREDDRHDNEMIETTPTHEFVHALLFSLRGRITAVRAEPSIGGAWHRP